MSNFVALSRSALYSAMASGREIYVLEGGQAARDQAVWAYVQAHGAPQAGFHSRKFYRKTGGYWGYWGYKVTPI